MKTTHEKAKEAHHENLVSNLQTILKKNIEAQEGYKNAMEHAKGNTLTEFLKQQSAQRGRFVNQLDNEIRSLNEIPVNEGSTSASMHRMWMDVKTTFAGNNDEALLEECIRGEESAVQAYHETLKENNFPPHLNSVIKSQAEEIESSLRTVKQLEVMADQWN